MSLISSWIRPEKEKKLIIENTALLSSFSSHVGVLSLYHIYQLNHGISLMCKVYTDVGGIK